MCGINTMLTSRNLQFQMHTDNAMATGQCVNISMRHHSTFSHNGRSCIQPFFTGQ
jgi:hypothetical protein